MRITFIGAGNVATHLAQALRANGNEITQVYSRTEQSAKLLADKVAATYTTSLADVRADTDMFIISVCDDAIAHIINAIGPLNDNAIYAHTAGSVPIDILRGHATRYGVMYPMQTFSKAKSMDLRRVPCYTEGSDEATLHEINALAASIFGNVREMTSKDRRYLHLAAVFACNFTNYCYDIASAIVGEKGIPFSDFTPLIEESVAKLREFSPFEAQTGPAVRYDKGVMQRQLDLLSDKPEWQAIYRLMSAGIHDRHS